VVHGVEAAVSERHWTNLVGNALIHAPRALAALWLISVAAAVSISDDGAGISTKLPIQAHRAIPNGAVPKKEGHGLGLSIIQEIMTAHEGYT